MGRALTRVWLFAVLFLAWWLWSTGSKSLYFPPLSSILKAVWDQWVTGPARAELSSSLEHLLVGYGIAAVAGIGLGAALWSLRYASARRPRRTCTSCTCCPRRCSCRPR